MIPNLCLSKPITNEIYLVRHLYRFILCGILVETKQSLIRNRPPPLQNVGSHRQILNKIANLFACALRNLVSAIVLETSGVCTELQKIETVPFPRICCPVDVRSGQI